MTYRRLQLPNNACLVQRGNQITYEIFERGCIKSIAKFKAGLRCSLENAQGNLLYLDTQEKIINFLECAEIDDSLIYF